MTKVMPKFKELIEKTANNDDIHANHIAGATQKMAKDEYIQEMNHYYREILASADEKYQNKCTDKLLQHIFSPVEDSDATLQNFIQSLWLSNKTRLHLLEQWQGLRWPAAEKAREQFEGIKVEDINKFNELISQSQRDIEELCRDKKLADEWNSKRANFQKQWETLERWATELQINSFYEHIRTENYPKQEESTLVLVELIESVTQIKTATLMDYQVEKDQLKADTNTLSLRINQVENLRNELQTTQREGIAATLNVNHLQAAHQILEQANTQYETKLAPHEISHSGIKAAKANITSIRGFVSQNLKNLDTDLQRTQTLLHEAEQRKIINANYQSLKNVLKTLLEAASKRVERYGNFFRKTKAKKQWTYTLITAIEQYQRKLVINNNTPLDAPNIDAMKTELSNLINKFEDTTKRRWVFFLPGVGSTSKGENDYIKKCQAELKKIESLKGLLKKEPVQSLLKR